MSILTNEKSIEKPLANKDRLTNAIKIASLVLIVFNIARAGMDLKEKLGGKK